jgi:hypothetical protein
MLEDVRFLSSLYFPYVTRLVRCSFPNTCSGPTLEQPLFVPDTRVVAIKLQFDTLFANSFLEQLVNPPRHITQ